MSFCRGRDGVPSREPRTPAERPALPRVSQELLSELPSAPAIVAVAVGSRFSSPVTVFSLMILWKRSSFKCKDA